MSAQTLENRTGLEAYRDQTRELEEAVGRVKAIQEETATITLARDAASSKRQSLLSNWTDSEEESVTELSKLAARAEVSEAKLAGQARKLVTAEAELKTALAAFAISFNSLFLTLRTYLVRQATERIAATIHPKVRPISGASIAEIAALSTEVIDFEPLAIRGDPMVSLHNNQLPPEAIQRDAERSLPKAEALLLEAAKHLENGFVPPAAFDLSKWQESLSPAVAAAAA